MLDSTCNTCAADVCASDPYCCDTAWDSVCVEEVGTICGDTCGANGLCGGSGGGGSGGSGGSGGGGGSTCSHSECSVGGKLTKTCDPCATKVCSSDSFCCSTTWDKYCVAEAKAWCGTTCQ
jgi:hypothetical protein